MRTKLSLPLIIVLLTMVLGPACTRFARTQNLHSKYPRKASDVILYVDRLPERPYQVVGIIEVKPVFQRLDSVFKGMRERAAKEGADGVIRIRETHNYYVGADFRRGDFYIKPNTRYYGDAIVFAEKKKAPPI
jgi:hypothetical protein